MTTLYLKKKPGDTGPRQEIKEITPECIEQGVFYFQDKYDSLCEVDQKQVDQFKTDSKSNAVKILDIFKPTGRYVCIVQSRKDYYVEIDENSMIRNGEKLIREVNLDNS
jgi:hypothetical protein